MREYEQELRKLGVELKDYFTGLIDFPCWMDGREVYLCWQLGEPEVAHWHELDAGFAGRQKLAPDGAARLSSPDASAKNDAVMTDAGRLTCCCSWSSASFFLFIHLRDRQARSARPSPDAEKLTIYECGEPTIGSAWIQFDLRYLRGRPAVRHLRRGSGVLLPVGGGLRQGQRRWRDRTPTTAQADRGAAADAASEQCLAADAAMPKLRPARSRRRRPSMATARRPSSWPGSPSATSWSSSACCWSASPTCGSAATSTGCAAPPAEQPRRPPPDRPPSDASSVGVGTDRMRLQSSDLANLRGDTIMGWLEGRFEESVITTTLEQAHQLGPRIEHVADDVRPGLLRHRDDGDRRARATTSTASAPAPSGPRRGRPT